MVEKKPKKEKKLLTEGYDPEGLIKARSYKVLFHNRWILLCVFFRLMEKCLLRLVVFRLRERINGLL